MGERWDRFLSAVGLGAVVEARLTNEEEQAIEVHRAKHADPQLSAYRQEAEERTPLSPEEDHAWAREQYEAAGHYQSQPGPIDKRDELTYDEREVLYLAAEREAVRNANFRDEHLDAVITVPGVAGEAFKAAVRGGYLSLDESSPRYVRNYSYVGTDNWDDQGAPKHHCFKPYLSEYQRVEVPIAANADLRGEVTAKAGLIEAGKRDLSDLQELRTSVAHPERDLGHER